MAEGKSNFKGKLGVEVIKKGSKLPEWKRQLNFIRENFDNLFKKTKVRTKYQEEHPNE